jgi:LAO/AO transport system kinase
LKKKVRHRHSLEDYHAGILLGDKVLLAQAITLAESELESDRNLIENLIEKIVTHKKDSIRIGITGSPGVGKSTFIETFGRHLTAQNKKVAVLAIDPSSYKTKGSILGDKTRMEELAKDPLAFIRPSATRNRLGGVAAGTSESIILCEAAGFEVIIIETVGVGQSETAVRNLVDFFLLLMLAGSGDELQGIKKGIMEKESNTSAGRLHSCPTSFSTARVGMESKSANEFCIGENGNRRNTQDNFGLYSIYSGKRLF